VFWLTSSGHSLTSSTKADEGYASLASWNGISLKYEKSVQAQSLRQGESRTSYTGTGLKQNHICQKNL